MTQTKQPPQTQRSSIHIATRFLATVLINADHPALEDAKEALDRVRCGRAARILAVAVVHSLMVGKVLAKRLCSAALRPCRACQ
jgi:hypothetical protein